MLKDLCTTKLQKCSPMLAMLLKLYLREMQSILVELKCNRRTFLKWITLCCSEKRIRKCTVSHKINFVGISNFAVNLSYFVRASLR